MKQKVQVWIYFKGSEGQYFFLLLQTTPGRGGFWQPVTGSVEIGETLEIAAAREVIEETGLKTSPISLQHSFQYKKNGQQFSEHAFAAEIPGELKHAPRVKLDPREHSEQRWVGPQEALQSVGFPSNAEVLRIILKRLGLKGL